MFGTGTNPFLEVALLKTFDECHAHGSRKIAILAIRFFQTIETRCATHIHHRRKRQHSTHLTHGNTCLIGLQFRQFGIERTSLSDLLGIDGGTQGVHTRQYLFVEQGRNTIGRMIHQPFLDGRYTVAQHIGIHGFLTGKLREMTDAVRNQLSALRGIKLSLLIEEVVHIHTSQLSNALLLRHPVVEIVNLLFYFRGFSSTTYQ